MRLLNSPTVLVRNVHKTYYTTKNGSERSIFRRHNRLRVDALRDINFVAYKGESIGVLGRNGSGKTTFLNLIAGNEAPTAGEIMVSSRPTYLGVSAALQNQLSGATNVRLGLLAMGIPRDEVEVMQREVLEWAELAESGERPLKTYSSGMRARLKFAISTAVRREILLVDEALSTGDSTFSAKATKRMNSFLRESGTVFIVSHAPGSIERYCKRAIWLHKGELIADGPTRAVTKYYRLWTERETKGNSEGAEIVVQNMRKRFPPKSLILDSEAIAMLDGRASKMPY